MAEEHDVSNLSSASNRTTHFDLGEGQGAIEPSSRRERRLDRDSDDLDSKLQVCDASGLQPTRPQHGETHRERIFHLDLRLRGASEPALRDDVF